MTQAPILITSFRPWRVHQQANSSDELLAEVSAQGKLPADAVWLPQVPVNFAIAPMVVLTEMMRLRPRLVICCGMAENRPRLSIESQAIHRPVPSAQPQTPPNAPLAHSLHTSADLSTLLADTRLSEISTDAGSYVCNHLYYSVLTFIYNTQRQTMGVFIHIPILSPQNKKLILNDFISIVLKLSQQAA